MSKIYFYKTNWVGIIACFIISVATVFILIDSFIMKILPSPLKYIVSFLVTIGITFGYIFLFDTLGFMDKPVELK